MQNRGYIQYLRLSICTYSIYVYTFTRICRVITNFTTFLLIFLLRSASIYFPQILVKERRRGSIGMSPPSLYFNQKEITLGTLAYSDLKRSSVKFNKIQQDQKTIKGTAQRDFRPQVLFIILIYLGHWPMG